MSVQEQMAQQIACAAVEALQIIRDGKEFPTEIFEQIERESIQVRRVHHESEIAGVTAELERAVDEIMGAPI